MKNKVLLPILLLFGVAFAQDTPVEVEQCTSKYNINEVLYNVKQGFLSGFKDCATDLVKETALAKSPLAKKPAPEPKSFMKQCVMSSINKKLEGVPSADKITNTVDNFLETLLKAALSGGDPKALVKAASNLDISGMMETISSLGSNSSCFVDEPYEPPMIAGGGDDGNNGYENFNVAERFATIIFPLGLGSGILMDNWKGTFIYLGLFGSGIAIVSVGRYIHDSDARDVILATGITISVIGVIYHIYQAVTYDKPREVAHSNKYGSLNMAVLPTRNGNGMAYGVVYNLGF